MQSPSGDHLMPAREGQSVRCVHSWDTLVPVLHFFPSTPALKLQGLPFLNDYERNLFILVSDGEFLLLSSPMILSAVLRVRRENMSTKYLFENFKTVNFQGEACPTNDQHQ